ncbi:CBS domain-containing protein [Candidatus Methanocrinis natronophilus]|uniref:CBS domain-containing protein n=1 Tax=Candidatus Methanocrinis natronophilus TaxID=3033396 RepID=A0ABT5X969_9EURY|nr:CBS domain-containing protein [Candidatus Methanocrinis natronophilus]MDF0591249.1 CBS domain-containing protein [Candidatus Methanocrinis natronophilus]
MMKVRDVMNPEPVAIQATAAVSDAVRLLRTEEISGMPVLEGEKLVGVVSESDLLKMLSVEREGGLWLPSPLEILEVPIRDLIRWEKLQAEAEEAGTTTVSEVMTRKVFTVGPEESIQRAASMMVRHRINRLPVLEGERLVGIVTRGDIIAGLGMEASEVEED